jgi:hypothetical protein
MSRDYPSLPITVKKWQVNYLYRAAIESDIWYDLPPKLSARLRSASVLNTDFVLTRDDLDSISDKAWAKILSTL